MNLFDQHLEDIVDKTWNNARRCRTWEDHVMNATLGLGGEAGEIVDLTKKMFYHSEKDRYDELINEIGDLCYYLAKLLQLHGITIEECLEANRVKLIKRYELE